MKDQGLIIKPAFELCNASNKNVFERMSVWIGEGHLLLFVTRIPCLHYFHKKFATVFQWLLPDRHRRLKEPNKNCKPQGCGMIGGKFAQLFLNLSSFQKSATWQIGDTPVFRIPNFRSFKISIDICRFRCWLLRSADTDNLSLFTGRKSALNTL